MARGSVSLSFEEKYIKKKSKDCVCLKNKPQFFFVRVEDAVLLFGPLCSCAREQ